MHRPVFMRALAGLTLATGLMAPAPQAHAVADCATDAMLVFDGSGSMNEFGYDPSERTRIQEAREAVSRAMPQIAPVRRIGLVIYGPGEASCDGIDLRFGPRVDAAGPVIDAVNALRPGGLTPLANSVQAAAEALDYRNEAGIVVLVTDGNETCGGRPCSLGAALAAEARDLTVHVIGFRTVVDYWTWDNPEQEVFAGDDSVARCLADRTGGMYVSTRTVDELSAALQDTLGCALIGAREQDLRAG
ncbi:vWA domain-containing protein [Pseudooceanicola atlanticus]|jgi:Ca-activated chloride channel family protein|uniref:VWFA domain-containing protein n=1 Tax=Pseudooceanicola atlanticus TaxID=1461694 RepID=A0A0A0EE59_9RHOB|nr:vWA domain-containing protein [Pseudooceanicola atlanticus]KGM47492.1 hypothetical protein ATO9_17860 [Pseudooceanicola atlanticus]